MAMARDSGCRWLVPLSFYVYILVWTPSVQAFGSSASPVQSLIQSIASSSRDKLHDDAGQLVPSVMMCLLHVIIFAMTLVFDYVVLDQLHLFNLTQPCLEHLFVFICLEQ